jgi:hypothetical protein
VGNRCCRRDGPIGWQCLHCWPHDKDGSLGGQLRVIHTSKRSPPLPRYPEMRPTIKPIGEPTTGPILCFHHFLTCRYGASASQCGARSNTNNLFLRLFFVPIFTYNGLVTSREQPQHTTNCHKQGNHGGGAACPSSNEDLINPLDLSRGQPKEGVGRGNQSKKSGSNT